ncbi:acyl-CoA/acyl-ACP dehydrogenase [Paenibacillus filicis]|uniref:Acyl-CoA/acyl-ACP dehydrogenase n=1 Tax=Paenibacillus gyeongsangnamensis TaxID=3388067 RepID=A0ABT4Q4E6_9BACL|nr:acyl-CoA dehydrogenase family protein [Paenibacillus filicis]MCZ8511711.1 acyl-CoA/acyl-ACP dehydrogenase [Paenibacillus filicis]
MLSIRNHEVKEALLQCLQKMVRTIDEDSVYPRDFIQGLGKAGFYSNDGLTSGEIAEKKLQLIEEVGSICNSTAFSIWCHVTSITYVRNGQSSYLQEKILPSLENGDLLGATGLSNPMKFYAGMESIRLKAKQTPGGYWISGTLPFVSNLGPDHWFGIIAELDATHRIMALINCNAEGLTLTERTDFMGINGSATYSCHFDDVFIPFEWILSGNADEFMKKIRAEFVLTQTGMALGLIKAAVNGMERLKNRQGEANQYLPKQPEEIKQQWETLREQAYRLAKHPSDDVMNEILRVRLNGSYLALEAANAAFLHYGGAGYVRRSDAARRLREAHFIAIVTPAVKQLEKLLKDGWGFKPNFRKVLDNYNRW